MNYELARVMLADYTAGNPIVRKDVITILKDVVEHKNRPAAPGGDDMPAFDPNRPQVPVRMVAKNWSSGNCKRCLGTHPPDGSVIVRIYGVGWWHDDCYRRVDPAFHDGL